MIRATDDLVGAAEVVEQLDIDRSTLTRWVASGTIIPVTKMRGRTGAYVFTQAEVDRVKRARDTG
jgi:predicted site-specific integrase-resolvase